MSTKILKVDPHQSLTTIVETMRQEGIAIVAIEENGILQGVLDRNGIENFLRLKSE